LVWGVRTTAWPRLCSGAPSSSRECGVAAVASHPWRPPPGEQGLAPDRAASASAVGEAAAGPPPKTPTATATATAARCPTLLGVAAAWPVAVEGARNDGGSSVTGKRHPTTTKKQPSSGEGRGVDADDAEEEENPPPSTPEPAAGPGAPPFRCRPVLRPPPRPRRRRPGR
jgi:hypothetical protein